MFGIYKWTHHDWILFRRAENLYFNKEYAEASWLYAKVLKSGDQFPNIKLHLAESYANTGKFGEAITLYRDLVKENPLDTQLRLALARTLSWAGDSGGAEKEYQKILDMKNQDEKIQK